MDKRIFSCLLKSFSLNNPILISSNYPTINTLPNIIGHEHPLTNQQKKLYFSTSATF